MARPRKLSERAHQCQITVKNKVQSLTIFADSVLSRVAGVEKVIDAAAPTKAFEEHMARLGVYRNHSTRVGAKVVLRHLH